MDLAKHVDDINSAGIGIIYIKMTVLPDFHSTATAVNSPFTVTYLFRRNRLLGDPSNIRPYLSSPRPIQCHREGKVNITKR